MIAIGQSHLQRYIQLDRTVPLHHGVSRTGRQLRTGHRVGVDAIQVPGPAGAQGFGPLAVGAASRPDRMAAADHLLHSRPHRLIVEQLAGRAAAPGTPVLVLIKSTSIEILGAYAPRVAVSRCVLKDMASLMKSAMEIAAIPLHALLPRQAAEGYGPACHSPCGYAVLPLVPRFAAQMVNRPGPQLGGSPIKAAGSTSPESHRRLRPKRDANELVEYCAIPMPTLSPRQDHIESTRPERGRPA